METMFWIWMAAAVIFLILELLLPTLFFACFAVGGFVSAIYAHFAADEYYWQVGVFIIVSVALLPLTRRFAKRITVDQPEHANIDRMRGKIAIVVKAIDADSGGQVKFEGEVWNARAMQNIEENARVKIVDVTGTRVNVERA
ncbi:MAG: NfeD family protein [candidate division Zixibacteria bacterium]|nr:NfeD family protein [candidate division Zixibacteria bacterium]